MMKWAVWIDKEDRSIEEEFCCHRSERGISIMNRSYTHGFPLFFLFLRVTTGRLSSCSQATPLAHIIPNRYTHLDGPRFVHARAAGTPVASRWCSCHRSIITATHEAALLLLSGSLGRKCIVADLV